MKKRLALALTFALGITACGREPVAPVPTPSDVAPLAQKGHVEGTGRVLENIAGLPLGLGDVVIRQAVIKEFASSRTSPGTSSASRRRVFSSSPAAYSAPTS